MAFIRNYFTILCSFYYFKKLLNIPQKRWQKAVNLILSAGIAGVWCLTARYVDFAGIFVTAALFCTAAALEYRRSPDISIVTTLSSFGLSYLSLVIAALAAAFVCSLLLLTPISKELVEYLSFVLTGILQMVVASIPFRFRRLKNGMSFLQRGKTGRVGSVISVLSLLLTSVFTANPSKDIRFAIYMAAIVICGVVLLIWWLVRLYMRYLGMAHKRDVETLNNEIEELKNNILELRENNESLAAIIHRDNKLIPAMELSVRELLSSVDSGDESTKRKAEELLSYLQSTASERSGEIFTYENRHKYLPQTGVSAVDSVIRYMQQRAYKSGANFDFTLNGSVKHLCETQITPQELTTLIADLCENALISEADSDNKNVLLCISVENGSYALDIFDSGAPFASAVIASLGKQQITTHGDNGGSGIGLVTTFDILKKYAASFILDDTVGGRQYTKKVSLCFDGLSQIRIKTVRPDVLALKAICGDIVWLET